MYGSCTTLIEEREVSNMLFYFSLQEDAHASDSSLEAEDGAVESSTEEGEGEEEEEEEEGDQSEGFDGLPSWDYAWDWDLEWEPLSVEQSERRLAAALEDAKALGEHVARLERLESKLINKPWDDVDWKLQCRRRGIRSLRKIHDRCSSRVSTGKEN